ncbi:hypothetical protein JYG38_12095 [Pseudomonas rhodesiae]|uniref:hypothetical protein n=1 Tax=Pseudomonas rhodesiae TaxID=76760 RepID=UPI000B8BCE5D|nr:hypothetical protein [Pseudomonas rhodesiae]OXS21239.1 hypothetical protein CGU36_14960 [Pseudomonas fluorescens]OZO48203.1 hypothetical protein CGU37_14005 [Pseudomonas fluorescens]QVN04135.1 hypothetical protein JYG38_12095 [Pseudomonas rhodesiae]TGY18719.1 hypothetical protein E5845_11505 [Pseudomonas fluorescens]
MTPVSVQAFVAEQHAPDTTLYLLLDLLADCTADDPLHIEALGQSLGNDAITPLHRPDMIHTPSACPVLVALATPGVSPSQQLLQLSARRAQEEQGRHKRYVCGWLISSAGARHLSAHIVSLGQLPLEQGQAFFPIHEPLRLELLASTFRRNDEGPWWPIRHWLLPTSSGAGNVLMGIPERRTAPNTRTTAVQQDAPMVSALLSSWRRALSLPLTYAPARWTGATALPPQAAAQAYIQIQQARHLGLSNQDDILTLALHRLLLHPNLHQHTGVRALIEQAAQGKAPLSHLLAPYNDNAWQRVVSDLTYAGAPQ